MERMKEDEMEMTLQGMGTEFDRKKKEVNWEKKERRLIEEWKETEKKERRLKDEGKRGKRLKDEVRKYKKLKGMTYKNK